jgi:hypothetical protein
LAASTIKEAAGNAQEKELFRQLVRAAGIASTTAPTGQTAASNASSASTTKQPTNAAGMLDQVRNTEQQQAQLSPQKLADAGQVLRQTFQIDSSIESTGDSAVDALLLAMGFRPA